MKLQRHTTSHGTMCDAAEVADLEAKYAELEAKCAGLEAINAEMMDVIKSLKFCSDYWFDFALPIGIFEKMNKVIAQAKGNNNATT